MNLKYMYLAGNKRDTNAEERNLKLSKNEH